MDQIDETQLQNTSLINETIIAEISKSIKESIAAQFERMALKVTDMVFKKIK